MPLKLKPPRKGLKAGSWTIRGSYLGVVVNQSTGTGKRAVAEKVLKQVESDIERGRFSRRGEKTFADAALAYMEDGGERTHVKKLVEYLRETPLSQIDQDAIDRCAAILYPGVTPATRNRSVYTPISAILHHAGVSSRLRRPRGAAGNKQTAWLWPEQVGALLREAEKLDKRFAALLIVLCYTGMRLSEALNLTWNNVRLEDGYVFLGKTKNGEPRAVYLPPVAVAALANLEHRSSGVFGFKKNGWVYKLLRVAAGKASVELPKRSAFHILRHTYGTWMRRYAGLDEIGLLSLGAWKDDRSVKRYAHSVVNEDARRADLLPAPVQNWCKQAVRGKNNNDINDKHRLAKEDRGGIHMPIKPKKPRRFKPSMSSARTSIPERAVNTSLRLVQNPCKPFPGCSGVRQVNVSQYFW